MLERIQYDPYGNTIGGSLTRYGFTGREHDAITDLIFFRARWYDPNLGRFMTEDPIGMLGGLNLYEYVGNEPIGMTDRLGLQTGRDWADKADKWLDRQADKRMTESWYFNYQILNLKSAVQMGTDLLRVGSGIGDAIYGDDPWYLKGLYVLQDVGRIATISLVLKGLAAAGTSIARRAATALAREGAAAVPKVPCNTPLGFAKGTAESAFTPNRLQHASRHLSDVGILPKWSKAVGEQFKQLGTRVLENPIKTFDHTLGGTPVKGFLGNVNGQNVVFFVFKSGPYQGQIATAFVPSVAQLIKWGL